MMTLHSRLIAFLIGMILIFLILFFIRKRYLEHLYSFIWILIGLFFISISFFPNIVELISKLLGIDFSPIGVLVISIIGLGAILLHMSSIITQHNKKIREFEKRLSILDPKNKS
tara:strand:- start:167 stop:508 length:342 start_codon:yes stop_codon:yes gene_type:complete